MKTLVLGVAIMCGSVMQVAAAEDITLEEKSGKAPSVGVFCDSSGKCTELRPQWWKDALRIHGPQHRAIVKKRLEQKKDSQ